MNVDNPRPCAACERHNCFAHEEGGEVAVPSGADWDVCEHCKKEDGLGVRLPDTTACWAHADEESLHAALQQLGETGVLDARGVVLTVELLKRILAAAPRNMTVPARPPCLRESRFDRATFSDGAELSSVWFGDNARFDGATIGAYAQFGSATFGQGARFDGATFDKGAEFRGAAFGNEVWFNLCRFGAGARFDGATFGDSFEFEGTTFGASTGFDRAVFGANSCFQGVTFGKRASFYETAFGDSVSFGGAVFGDDAAFDGAVFGDRVDFRGVSLGDRASFNDAVFGDWVNLGPILVVGELQFQRATFGRSPELAVSANRVRCDRAKFPDGGYLRIRWAELTLDGAHFSRPLILAKAPPFKEFDDTREAALVELVQADGQSYRTDQPRPICLAGCDVDNLAMNDCDLRACRFIAAHHLAALRLESAIVLPSTPAGWWRGRAWPPVWRWGPRQTVAEEHHWRDQRAKSAGWRGAASTARSPYVADWHGHAWRDDPAGLSGPTEIAAAYRALRKGREDENDEPGAADFYYGEMEMRRHDSTKSTAERLVLLLYWLVSGYALRASRAVAWLVGVLIVATVLLASVGLDQPTTESVVQATITGTPPRQSISFQAPGVGRTEQPFVARLGTAALIAVEGAVFRASEQDLTYTGRLIQAVLRFVGPILLALAVLSIRGRVKR